MLQMTHYFSAQINSLKNRLERIKQVVLRDYPELSDSTPSPDGIKIKKLGQHGLIMTDSCNTAQKARGLLWFEIGGLVFEMDCHHHLCNVWIKGMKKSGSIFLRVVLTDCLSRYHRSLESPAFSLPLLAHGINFSAYAQTIPRAKGSTSWHG